MLVPRIDLEVREVGDELGLRNGDRHLAPVLHVQQGDLGPHGRGLKVISQRVCKPNGAALLSKKRT